MKRSFVMTMAVVLAASAAAQAVEWRTIFSEDFSDPNGWSYSGVQNASSQNLIRPDGSGKLAAEWDQSNAIAQELDGDGKLKTTTLTSSTYSKPLGQTLTDADWFRFGATVNFSSIGETTEFFQIANFGLTNMATTGPDRTYSGGGNFATANNTVEFNYFNTTSPWALGRNVQPTMIAEDGTIVGGSTLDGWTSAHFADALPTSTDLFVQVTYRGDLRRSYAAVYTDADRTSLLKIGEVAVEYWTTELPADKSFVLTDAAFMNYVSTNWGGANGEGAGTFDDFYVQVPEPATLGLLGVGAAAVWMRRRGK